MKTKKIIPGTVKINSQICDDGGGNLITNKGKFELGKEIKHRFTCSQCDKVAIINCKKQGTIRYDFQYRDKRIIKHKCTGCGFTTKKQCSCKCNGVNRNKVVFISKAIK